eukprot:scaffold35761_cov56-Phaeocystis_antarctica.AAC.5
MRSSTLTLTQQWRRAWSPRPAPPSQGGRPRASPRCPSRSSPRPGLGSGFAALLTSTCPGGSGSYWLALGVPTHLDQELRALEP